METNATAETIHAKANFDERVRQLTEEVGFVVPAVLGKTAPDFLDRFVGIFANDPDFDDVVRFSEDRREREREEANKPRNQSCSALA